MRILVVESEPSAARVLQKGLEANSFAVDISRDGEDGLQLATEIDYDAMIINAALPGLDGLSMVKRLRGRRALVPILMLGKRPEVSAIVQGLAAGADEYMAKPFAFEELLARLEALLRRPREAVDKMRVDDLELDRVRGTVTRGGKSIRLTTREFGVLECLMRNAGRVVTRNIILGHVWEPAQEGATNIVDVYINYLRIKLDQGFRKKLIHTARGAGYILQTSERCSSVIDFPVAAQQCGGKAGDAVAGLSTQDRPLVRRAVASL